MAVSGELDHHTSPELTLALRDVPFTADSPTVIDLTGLAYCDSTGITVLVTAYQRAKHRTAVSWSPGLDHGLMRVFQIVGLDQILTFAPTVVDAVGILRPTG